MINFLKYYLSIIAVIIVSSQLNAQQDLYKWRIGGGAGNIHIGGELHSQADTTSGDEIVSFDPNFLAWTLSVEYLASESFGFGIFGISESGDSDLKDAGVYFRYYTDNRNIFGRKAFIAPFFNLGIVSNKHIDNFAIPIGAGLKFRLPWSLNLNLNYSAMLYSDQWDNIGESFQSNYISYTSISLHYNFSRRKHHFKAPKIYSSGDYQYLQKIVIPLVEDLASEEKIEGGTSYRRVYKPDSVSADLPVTQDAAVPGEEFSENNTLPAELRSAKIMFLDKMAIDSLNVGIVSADSVINGDSLNLLSDQLVINDSIHALTDSTALSLLISGDPYTNFQDGSTADSTHYDISDTLATHKKDFVLLDTSEKSTIKPDLLVGDSTENKPARIESFAFGMNLKPGVSEQSSSLSGTEVSQDQASHNVQTDLQQLEYEIRRQELINELEQLKMANQDPQLYQQKQEQYNPDVGAAARTFSATGKSSPSTKSNMANSSQNIKQGSVVDDNKSSGPIFGLSLGINRSKQKPSDQPMPETIPQSESIDTLAQKTYPVTAAGDTVTTSDSLSVVSVSTLAVPGEISNLADSVPEHQESDYIQDSLLYLISLLNDRLIELEKLTKSDVTVNESGAKEISKAEVFFNINSTDLSEGAKNVLAELITNLSDDTMYIVDISGYADRSGNPEYNQLLSRKRALSVKNFLVQNGINEERINIEYMGADLSLKPNEQAYGRRVEIVIKK